MTGVEVVAAAAGWEWARLAAAVVVACFGVRVVREASNDDEMEER